MKRKIYISVSVCMFSPVIGLPAGLAATPVGSAFTYQGKLKQSGSQANGTFSMTFTLFASSGGVDLVGSPITLPTVSVTDGLFTVSLDFGSAAFDGNGRWLAVSVAGTPLSPRQELTPTPHAIFAKTAQELKLPYSVTQAVPAQMMYLYNNGTGANAGAAIWAQSLEGAGILSISEGAGTALFAANAGTGPSGIFLGGNVGIGTQTPQEKLTVDGTIYSRSGGVRFPDGSLQITASESLWQSDPTGIHTNSGNVGIGTELPDSLLHVNRPFDTTSLHLQTQRFSSGNLVNTTKSPASAVTSGLGQSWTNPANALTSNNAYATTSLDEPASFGLQPTGSSRFLELSDFGFAIPIDATVISVEVSVEGRASSDCAVCDVAQVKMHEVLLGVVNPFERIATLPIAEGVTTISSAWSQAPITPAILNSPSFGVRIFTQVLPEYWDIFGYAVCDNCQASSDVTIDAVTIKVTYHEAAGSTVDVNWAIGIPENGSQLVIAPETALGVANGIMVKTDGKVGIGVDPGSTHKLVVDGTAAKPGGGTWAAFCDQRLKRDITPMTGTLDRLLSLHGHEFNYTDEASQSKLCPPGRHIGLIAQEVQKVFPDWVGSDEHGYLFVTEHATTALMAEALRDLRNEKDCQLAERDANVAAMRQEYESTLKAVRDEKQTVIEEQQKRIEKLERALADIQSRLNQPSVGAGAPEKK